MTDANKQVALEALGRAFVAAGFVVCGIGYLLFVTGLL